jgi:pyoverdine/dityrosine biosynthesis protein Dit1
MELYLHQLEKYLIKNYFIVKDNVSILVEDEFEFIEECFNAQISVAIVAKELIDIYMVA